MSAGQPLRGCAVGLIGIDGAGKTTLAGELERRLSDQGVDAVRVSRRGYLKSSPPDFAGSTITALYEGALRTLYGFAGLADGRVLGEDFPPLAGEIMSDEFEKLLNTSEIVGNNPSALVASMLSEIAGSLAFRESIIRPHLAAGRVVIEDTHAIKMVIKLYLLGSSVSGDETQLQGELDAALRAGIDILRPADRTFLPVFVRTDPEVAYRRRLLQHGQVGGMEHYGPVGRAIGADSYLELQTRSQQIFEDIADRWACVRIDLSADDREYALTTAAEHISSALHDRGKW
ncbi:hypothetical protein NONI108955_22560 [Nocardia ninae]|uniref:Thymidylate kinase n=1 Tax=Nocardia ninae NBRC 108245 TaxID=1210091 RepID=A0A511MCW4_9NOCA|nr:hypothetical protein [Nocardia ninae]GEM38514.1 hypothetical protein NN4_30330 [Nocardia ninae NBRC 108245]